MLSKSNAESLNKYGLVGPQPDEQSAKSRKVRLCLAVVTSEMVSSFRTRTTIASMKMHMERDHEIINDFICVTVTCWFKQKIFDKLEQ